MGQSGRRSIRRAWAAMINVFRERARKSGGVGQADQARRESDWTLAVQGYETYLRRAPRDFGVWVRLIKTLYSAGRLDEAEKALRAAIADRPDKGELEALLGDVLSARQASIPAHEYDRFRRSLIIPQAPVLDRSAGLPLVTAVIDGRDKSSYAVGTTLESLRKSKVPVDYVVLWSRDDQESDGIRGVKGESSGEVFTFVLNAGVVVNAEALSWLLYALYSTGAIAAYSDDDRRAAFNGNFVWSSPAFHACPHPADMATTPRVPEAVLLRGEWESPVEMLDRRTLLLKAFRVGAVAHVPLLLASQTGEQSAEVLPLMAKAFDVPNDRILAIIPTRDEGAVLSVMIDGLIAKAANPERLEILVVDNGSRDLDTIDFLKHLVRDGTARVLRVDEPFNWSRLNNLAAIDASAEILLFANNDMRMLTPCWDNLLRANLAVAGVGAIGARLTYPNGSIQHAGMALGALHGKPVHEGLGAGPSDVGPLMRWVRTRPAAAVTGAFLGVRREVFEAVGGFNAEEFAVGCNDIDFCLRVRAKGWTILYAADLELVHWESHSRGHDDTESKRRRAEAEFAALDRIWGEAARYDHSRNPHWVNHETLLFFGLRQPDSVRIMSWIRETAQAWRPPSRIGQASDRTPIS